MHRIITAVILLTMALVLSGCVTGHLSGETIGQDGSSDSYKYRTVAVVPPFGKLAEQANQYSYICKPDGTWEIISGQQNAGIDASGQIEALQSVTTALQQIVTDLAPMLKLLASGGIDISGLFGGAEISTDAIEALEKLVEAWKEKEAATPQ
jgi:hypothetical protein